MIGPRSIAWKLCFLFAGVQLLVGVVFVATMRRVRDEALRGRPPSMLADRAELAAHLVRAALPSDPTTAALAAALPRRFAEDGYGPALAILDSGGAFLAASPGFEGPGGRPPGPAGAPVAQGPGWPSRLATVPSSAALELHGDAPLALVKLRDRPALYLAAAFPRRHPAFPWPPHLVIPGLLLLAAGVGGILGVMLITRRVRDAEAGIDRLASGDLAARIDPGPEDEFGKLLRAVNAMALELGRQDQARKNMLADISHELRTPLTSLMCQLDLLESRLLDAPDAHRRSLAIAREDGATLGVRIADLLALARDQLDPPALARERVNLQKLLGRIAERFVPLLRPAGIRLETRFVPEIVELDLDPRRITQVFENLLDNAKKALEDGGTVVLGVRPGPDRIEIEVADDGPGVPESQADMIFERFQRGRGSHGPGTGLGLAIARRLVELHGGTCAVRAGPGGGACFTVTLPRPGSA